MNLTRHDRERLGQLLGAPVLGGHALAAGWMAVHLLGLPMEAGGLILGPMIGLPLAGAALAALVGAVLFVTGRTPLQAVAALVLCTGFDLATLAMGFGTWWAVAGAVVGLGAVGLFASLIQLRLDGPHTRDQMVFVATFALVGVIAVIVTLGTA